MKLDKATKRDKKRHKKKNGMIITGKSVFLILNEKIKRAERIKSKRG